MFLPTISTWICKFAVVQKDVIAGSWSSKLDGQVRSRLPCYVEEADGGTSPGAGATGTVKHWITSGRSCFTAPETSQFLAETFIVVAQPNGEKGIKYSSLGHRYDAL